ncbi:arginine--tRNA ligase [Putridiphycobacter roseus]|uniref:Arginine--tRNA ligase n=1 Tax=Putridiphycobacter roseus TaxID=2219161 RepID=A0A2W1N378_9FLAO|nr:arginine--tRNA ligase [Putridiphycobacter roseus]PZE17471.1 arginine--tRNA ligase [Putridiphycobacter roseus]
MSLEKILLGTVQSGVQALYNQTFNENLIQFQKTKKEFDGDITLVTFPIVKFSKEAPHITGEKLGAFLLENSDLVSAYNVVKGFLNLSIVDTFWVDQLNTISETVNYGFSPSNGKLYMVEYSSPNTNKPLHLGHLRNNFLGYSVAEILKANGFEVVKTQIVNDRGIHICKSMLAWEQFGNGETPESTGLKGDKLVGKYYVRFDQELKKETKALVNAWVAETNDDQNLDEAILKLISAYQNNDESAQAGIFDKLSELAKNQTAIMKSAQDMLLKWEQKDPAVYKLWSTLNGWVYDGFESTYQAMGVDFDKLYYESETYLTGKDLVEDGLKKGIFFQKDDGSIWIDLTDDGLDEKLVLRGDGTAVYMTQDMGTASQRFLDYPKLNGITYTVGNEQDYHFKVLFLILKKLGYAWAENCFHLSYGMVDLPTGKMKSREGTVVDADDLMQEVVDKAKAGSQERGHLEGMSDTDKNNLYQTIGMGGLKYYLLKVDPKKRMLFNPEESVDLNGNTGPFIQYAFARINSLLKSDFKVKPVLKTVELHDSEREIIKLLIDFPQVIKEAGTELSPALIANYTYELVKLYNSFYQSVSIFKESDDEKINLRLNLSKNVGDTIKKSMHLLGINVPNQM